MLDRVKAAQKLTSIIDHVFVDATDATVLAQQIWHTIAKDPTLPYKIRESNSPWPIPEWSESLSHNYRISSECSPYRVLAIDGSQIYPDRHYGVSCFLINIGSVLLSYGLPGKSVVCRTIPYIFNNGDHEESSQEAVNCRRQELELAAGLEYVRSPDYVQQVNDPFLLLYDGSLIFWHLDTKDTKLKDIYLPRYLALLYQLYQERVLLASYISFPRSRELVNIVRLALCDFDGTRMEDATMVDRVVDGALLYGLLEPGMRTIVFKNNAKIADAYPDAVRPYFFYLHVGYEIGRVEIPAWIAQENHLVDTIAACIYDQNNKGRGYPVALAESHEQAVIKGPDRDFFYHLLSKLYVERKQRMHLSQKSIKKRGIGI